MSKIEEYWATNVALRVARTTESIFHQNITNMLAPGDIGPFEKCRNAFFSDFDVNWRYMSKFEKKLFLDVYLPFLAYSFLYVICSVSADFKFVI